MNLIDEIISRPAPGTYHKDIYLPASYREILNLWALNYTKHALRAALDDRYGTPTLPRALDLRPIPSPHIFEVIEVEVNTAGFIAKAVIRISENRDYDLVFVIIPEPQYVATVKTVWRNLVSDRHCTLNRSRYIQAPK